MSNNSSAPPPVGITDTETWIINTVFYLIGGITGVITNFMVFYTIIRDKNLRASSFFVELCIVSLNRCTASGQDFILAIYRFLKLLNLANAVLDRSSCYSLFLALMHFSQVDFAFLSFVAIDRIVAIAKPLAYKLRTPKKVAAIFVSIFMIAVLANHVSELSDAMPPRIACVNVISPKSPRIYYAGTVITLVLSFIIVLSYVALISYILGKYRPAKPKENAPSLPQFDVTMKRHLEVLRALSVMVVSTGICAVIPRCLFFFASFSPASSVRLVAYAGALSNIDFNVMCWALLTRSSEFRTAFRKRFLRKLDQIQPTSTANQRSNLFQKRTSAVR